MRGGMEEAAQAMARTALEEFDVCLRTIGPSGGGAGGGASGEGGVMGGTLKYSVAKLLQEMMTLLRGIGRQRHSLCVYRVCGVLFSAPLGI